MIKSCRALLLASSAVLAAAAGFSAASAADLSSFAPPIAAPTIQAPVGAFNWTGAYAGLTFGGMWGAPGDATSTAFVDPTTKASLSGVSVVGQQKSDATGFLAGAKAGYNIQSDAWVVGVETDFSGVNLTSRTDTAYAYVMPHIPRISFNGHPFSGNTGYASASIADQINWLGTTRLRAGYAGLDGVLVYATGGMAYGGVNAHTNVVNMAPLPIFGTPVDAWSGSSSKARFGWTIGAGVDYAIAKNVTLGVEYLYYNLGSVNYNVNYAGWPQVSDPVFAGFTTKHTFDGSVARVSLSYRM